MKTPTAAPGQINAELVDRFTLVHAGVGVLLGYVGLSGGVAAAVAVGWELLERPLKDSYPQLFPNPSQDSLPNMIGDSVAMMLGWMAGRRL